MGSATTTDTSRFHPGLFGRDGYHLQTWASPTEAARVAAELNAERPDVDVLPNPHLTDRWALEAVTSPALLHHITGLLGPAVAVENSFLVAKWPTRPFAVPPHQDGVNDAIELDPHHAVSVWLAITAAPPAAGCLEVAAGSHRAGYLPYGRAVDDEHTAGGRRPITITDGYAPPEPSYAPVPVPAGAAVVFDVRLVHRSGLNTTDRPRLGFNIRYVAPNAFRRGQPAERTGWLMVAGDQPADFQPHDERARA